VAFLILCCLLFDPRGVTR